MQSRICKWLAEWATRTEISSSAHDQSFCTVKAFSSAPSAPQQAVAGSENHDSRCALPQANVSAISASNHLFICLKFFRVHPFDAAAAAVTGFITRAAASY